MSLENQWYVACPIKDLGTKPKAVTIYDRHLVVFRDQDGGVAVLEDRCSHRGAPLSTGKICGQNIECPYHGWLFDADGNIADIPAQITADTNNPRHNIKSYPCQLKGDFVFVCIGDTPSSNLVNFFQPMEREGWSNFIMETIMETTTEACLENFLDCPHAEYVHKGWFRTPTGKVIKTIVRDTEDGAEAEYFEEPREKSLVWAILAPNTKQSMKHIDRFIAPSTSQVTYDFQNGWSYVIVSHCQPISKTKTKVFTQVSFKCGIYNGLIKLFFPRLARQIILQDKVILDATQKNNERFDNHSLKIISEDLLASRIYKMRSQLKKQTEIPSSSPAKEDEIELRL